ncbi:MAG TPA: DUF5615 family PIN-like protein [Methylomirabilota bacterium]|nr:DUF5615 family PIN-like protein [Methylomirabilota bacterium]
MLRFVADEDFTRAIVRGVCRARSTIDIVRVQDVGLRTQEDAVVLNWAATEGRIVLTHDVQTMPAYAYERVRNGLPMPGVFVVPQNEAIGRIIEDLILLAECSKDDEWEGQVQYLPLK